MDALAAMHDAAVQMIDTSIVRVHQHGSCIAGKTHSRSRGGLTMNIHAVVDTNGFPVQIGLTPGETHDGEVLNLLKDWRGCILCGCDSANGLWRARQRNTPWARGYLLRSIRVKS
jgi:Transposase DDE domain